MASKESEAFDFASAVARHLGTQFAAQLAPRLQLEIAHTLAPLPATLLLGVQQAASSAAAMAAGAHAATLQASVAELRRQVAVLSDALTKHGIPVPPLARPGRKRKTDEAEPPAGAAPAASTAPASRPKGKAPQQRQKPSESSASSDQAHSSMASWSQWAKNKRRKTASTSAVVSAALNGARSGAHVHFDDGEASAASAVDYEGMPPLSDLPRVGDVLAYKRIVMSTSMTPEMSTFRQGKVVAYDPSSGGMQLDEQDVHDMLDTSQDVTLSALSDVRLVERRTSDT